MIPPPFICPEIPRELDSSALDPARRAKWTGSCRENYLHHCLAPGPVAGPALYPVGWPPRFETLDATFVRLKADAGLTGWAEGTP